MQKAQELSHPVWMVTHGRVGEVPDRGQGGNLLGVAGRLGLIEDLDHRAGGGGLAQEGRGPGQIVGPEHHVDVRCPLADLLPVHLGQAPAHRDLHAGSALAQCLEVAQVPVELVVRILTDAAGVEDHHIGRLEIGGGHQSVGDQGTRQPFRVVLVHLAPEGSDVEGPGPGWPRAVADRVGCRQGGGHCPRIRPPGPCGRGEAGLLVHHSLTRGVRPPPRCGSPPGPANRWSPSSGGGRWRRPGRQGCDWSCPRGNRPRSESSTGTA